MGAAVDSVLQALQESNVGVGIAASPWLFPTIETVHVLAIAFVIGSIAMLDLRLIGKRWLRFPVVALASHTLPLTWAAFAVAVVSGALMFISNATVYGTNRAFQIKFLLIVAAGVNMLLFHATTYRSVLSWQMQLPPPPRARLAGSLSLCFWIGVVAAGRWIGFTL